VNKQTEATNHIKQLLSNSGLDLQPKKLTLPDGQQWNVFEREGKQVGIDTASGVWIRVKDDDWRCSAPRGAKMEWMENPFACTGRR